MSARKPIDASFVKRRARELGADLVGIASAATLNAFPPDPRWPQTPDRISPGCRSVVVLVQRIPAGAFRCKTNVPVQYIDMLVLLTQHPLAEVASVSRKGWFELAEMSRALGSTGNAIPYLAAEKHNAYLLTAHPDRYPHGDRIIEIGHQ